MSMKLQLTNFRKFSEYEVEINNNTTILTGLNGSGKSSIIEALYYCGFFKSEKTIHSNELIKFDNDFSKVVLKKEELLIEINLLKTKSSIYLNNIKVEKVKSIAAFNVLLIDPQVIEVISKTPSVRRSFINRNMCQLNEHYLKLQLEYNYLVKQKNRFLKNNNYDVVYHNTVNESLFALNEKIVELKITYVDSLEVSLNKILQWITKGDEEIKFNYLKKEFEANKTVVAEKKYQTSCFGNQLDDIEMLLNGYSLKKFGSQGQKRLVSICMMLAQMDLIYQQTKVYPYVMIDDLHAELDFERQLMLHKLIKSKTDYLIATPSIKNLNEKIIRDSQIIEL